MRSLFFIARHGQTILNDSGKFRGWSDGPDAHLNEAGIHSAHLQGAFLANTQQKFSRIISSPLNRAQHTAAIIAGYLGIEKIYLDKRLLPLNVGDLAGQEKSEHPIDAYLKNKNKRFPGGENVNEFEGRQHSFAEMLLSIIEAEKADEDLEVLVVAHVSNVMYWWNLQTGANSDEYLGETSDIIEPGGVAMVTEHDTIPILKSNPEAEDPGLKVIESKHVKGEPGTGFEKGAGRGKFECGNCAYFKNGNACTQEVMKEKSQQRRHENGDVVVDADDCCEYIERPE